MITLFLIVSLTIMLDKPSISDQRIIDCLNTEYGIKAPTLTFLPMGADMNASVYKAQTNDQSHFVKLKRNYRYTIGVALQALLHDAGIEQIIAPVKTTHGQITQSIDDFTLIVYPFIEGQDGFSRELTDDQWITLGRTLSNIHAFNMSRAIKGEIRRESYSPKWRDAIRSIYAHIEAKPIVDDEVALKLLMFMKKHRLIIQRLVDRAEQLAQKIQEQSPEFVLCHSDIHAGNVLIARNNKLYIVDWDDPIMAPKERDLMFIGGGIAHVWNNPREEELFYQGYGKTDINMTILAYYRHERIVEDIALYAQQLLYTMTGGNDRLEMYYQFIGMFDPHDVVDIAFKTGKNM